MRRWRSRRCAGTGRFRILRRSTKIHQRQVSTWKQRAVEGGEGGVLEEVGRMHGDHGPEIQHRRAKIE